MLARLGKLIGMVLLLTLVLVALYEGLGRILMGTVDGYRGDIESLLEEALGQPVSLGAVSGDWQWLDPVIEVRDLELAESGDPTHQMGRIGRIRIRMDSLASLLAGQFIFRDLLANNVDITFQQSPDGALSLQGVPRIDRALFAENTTTTVWSGQLGGWRRQLVAALSDPLVRLNNVHLGLKVPDEAEKTFLFPRVDFGYRSGVLSASGQALQPDSAAQLARFYVEGNGFFEGRFTGRLFVDVDSGRLFDGLIKHYSWQQKTINGFDVKGEGWLHFVKGRLESVNARLALPYLQFSLLGETQAPMEAIRARVGWRRIESKDGDADANSNEGKAPAVSNDSWTLNVSDLSWHWLNTAASSMAFQVTHDSDWDIAGKNLAVAPLTHLALATVSMNAEVHQILAAQQPAGLIKTLHSRVPESSDEFTLEAQFENVSVQAYGGIPGTSNLAGTLVMDKSAGRITVDSPDVTLGFPALFNGPWTFDKLATQVRWQVGDGTTRIQSDQIEMTYQNDTHFEGAFEFILNQPGNDTLSLRVGVQNADGSMLADFVPAKVVNDQLYTWLTTAIESATIDEGQYYGHGLVNPDSPAGSFNSAMRYRFSGGRVRYDENWPAVTDLAGNVVVEDSQARVSLAQGLTNGLELKPSQVTVDGDAEPATVTVDTAATINGEQVAQWLASTPLSDYAGDAAQALTLSGNYDLGLKILLPLAEDRDPVLDVNVATENSEIRYSDGPVVWKGVTGALRYRSTEGFSSEPLTANFIGEPVKVGFSRTGEDNVFQLVQSGRVVVNRLLERLSAEPIPGVSGRANYSARLSFATGEPPALRIQSSLANLAIDWPEPLGKNVGDTANLTLKAGWNDQNVLRLYGAWQDRFAWNLKWRDNRFDRGGIELGAPKAILPDQPGLEVTGDTPRFDLAAWQKSLNELLPAFQSWQGESGDNGINLKRVSVNVGQLAYDDHRLDDVRLTVEPKPEGWSVALDGPSVRGKIQFPKADQPIAADFKHLALNIPMGESSAAEKRPSADEKQPPANEKQSTSNESKLAFDKAGISHWPDIDFSVDILSLNNRPFGKWSLQLRPHEDVLRIRQIKGQVGSLTLDSQLQWRRQNQGASEQTQFKGELSGQNLADIAPLIEGSVPLRSGKTNVQFDLAWDGPPPAASLATVAGLISFRLDDGALLERNNTAQIFRVFGILNSDTLMRRLRLDFSDLYEAGVAFDAISGTARLRAGSLTWDPEMQIVGPSGAFKFSGSTDMVNENLDMRMVVVLPLTQNLPLAALLMGASAPIGGALFVLDKVLGDPLSKLTSATYHVGGTWNDPDVELRNVFDTGN